MIAGLAVAGLIVSVASAGTPLAHSVFFELKEDTPANRQKLLAACHEHLDGHDGCAFFAVGEVAEDLKREVNDRSFDVALHMVFEDRESHDRYQTHERHLAFIDQALPLIAKVRVFDADLASPADAADASEPTR